MHRGRGDVAVRTRAGAADGRLRGTLMPLGEWVFEMCGLDSRVVPILNVTRLLSGKVGGVGRGCRKQVVMG